MNSAVVLEMVQNAVWIALLVGAPMLLTAMLVGVIVSLVQAVTQIQEQTLTFVPKLAAVAAAIVVSLPWILRTLVTYLSEVLRSIPTLTG